MPSSFRFRLLLLAAAMFLLVVVVALLAHLTWSQSVAVRAQFRMVHDESLQLSEHIRGAVQSLDTNLLQYKIGHDPRDWRDFNNEAADLQHWLDQQRAALRTPRETLMLATIVAELKAYLADARVFAAADETLPPGGTVSAQLAALDQRSEKLLGLGFDLAEAHSATLDSVLARTDRAVARIEWSTFIALALLLAAGSGTAWVVFRDSILPLQRQLHDSRLQLQRQEKLASLGVLSAGIAHEIRNPLTALKARLFTLRKAISAFASGETLIAAGSSAAEDVGVINSEVDRLERIVREILRFARPPEPDLAAVDPIALLRRVRDLIAPQWTAAGVRLELDETPTPALEGDADQLEQALINLVQNAAEAMPGGGVVRLRAFAGGHLPSIPGARRRAAVTLEVADNGSGIAPDVQPRLFDPFFTTKSNGTGLGLALTARILEKNGGRISFETAPGRGTTFTLVLPAMH
jgi:signal transduction histidine kinase